MFGIRFISRISRFRASNRFLKTLCIPSSNSSFCSLLFQGDNYMCIKPLGVSLRCLRVCLWSSALFNLCICSDDLNCSAFRLSDLVLSVTLTNRFHSNCIFFFISRCYLMACVCSCVGMKIKIHIKRLSQLLTLSFETKSHAEPGADWFALLAWDPQGPLCSHFPSAGIHSLWTTCGSCIRGIYLLVDTGLLPWGLINWDRSGSYLGDT